MCLVAWGLSVDLHILDNKARAAYKKAITFKWNATFQLAPPDMHRRNWVEGAICTFKDHFLAIVASVDSAFPPYLWDLLLPQTKLTLNLHGQGALNPQISAWVFFQGPFNFNKTPLGPVGCCVLIQAMPSFHWSWDFHAKNGFYIGPALESYRCFKLVDADTKSQLSNTVEFRYSYLSVPAPSKEDQIVHGLQIVAGALAGAAPPTSTPPRWTQLPTFKISLNHGACLCHRPSCPCVPQCKIIQACHPMNLQGCVCHCRLSPVAHSCRFPLGVLLPCQLPLHCHHPPQSCLASKPCPKGSTSVMRLLQGW
jgi:hypothetical protein